MLKICHFMTKIRYNEGPINHVLDLLPRQVVPVNVNDLSVENLPGNSMKISNLKAYCVINRKESA